MIASDWVFATIGKAIFACGGYVFLLYVLGIIIMKAINMSGQYVTFFKIAQEYFRRKRGIVMKNGLKNSNKKSKI